MKEERIFRLLLSAKDSYKLFSSLGETILNHSDFVNYSNNDEAYQNSFLIFEMLGYIKRKDGIYKKCVLIANEAEFRKKFFLDLKNNKNIPFKTVFNCDIYYDSFLNKFYVNRNSIKLEHSGLIMILIDLHGLEAKDNRLYFLDSSLLDTHKPSYKVKNNNDSINPDLLDKILELEQKLGEEAEEKALLFEKKRLLSAGVTKEPIHISKFDCKAGFDIASYENENDSIPTRFIEIKSVDASLKFYISRNEIENSKVNGDRYFLYLYNRVKKSFIIIQNPFKEVFTKEKWDFVPQLFECKRK